MAARDVLRGLHLPGEGDAAVRRVDADVERRQRRVERELRLDRGRRTAVLRRVLDLARGLTRLAADHAPGLLELFGDRLQVDVGDRLLHLRRRALQRAFGVDALRSQAHVPHEPDGGEHENDQQHQSQQRPHGNLLGRERARITPV
jgi:hypothetical protein